MAASTHARSRVRRLTASGVLSALAVVLALTVRFPILAGAPYLLYEPSDVPLLLGAFRLTPRWVTGMALVVALAMASVGGGGIVGMVSRFVGSAALALTAAVLHRRLARMRAGRFVSVAFGVLVYTVAEVALTVVLGPLFFGDLGAALALILPVVIPFNLIKGSINGLAALLVDSALGAFAGERDGRT